VVIAQDSGNRDNESHLALNLAWLEAEHGDTASAFDHLTLSIRNYHDSRNTALIRAPLAILAALFDRLGRYEAAATIAEFVANPFTTATNPEITTAIAHLRDVLGDQTYESLARKGETMTTAAMAYAYDQIDQARAELDAVSAREPESADHNAALIAEHLEAAGDLHAAYGWHMRAATWATNRDIAAARLSWERAQTIGDALRADDPNRAAMRIAPRTMLCGIAWR